MYARRRDGFSRRNRDHGLMFAETGRGGGCETPGVWRNHRPHTELQAALENRESHRSGEGDNNHGRHGLSAETSLRRGGGAGGGGGGTAGIQRSNITEREVADPSPTRRASLD